MKRSIPIIVSLLLSSGFAVAVETESVRSVKLATQEIQGKLNPLLNGGNCAAPIANRKSGGWGPFREQLKELNIPITRLHDSPLFDTGVKIVDVSMIFANFDADPNDPKNYWFDQTDEYIGNCLKDGTKIFYRLGQSIEHGEIKYFTKPPKDFEKWTDICAHIIAHYNEGWANGYRWNIEYWEIWNEPDNSDQCWQDSEERFIEFYITVAKRLKAKYPNLKIGGPAMCYGSDYPKFIPAVAAAKAPLDFYSFHAYMSDLDLLADTYPRQMRKLLDDNGLTKTELILDEWHYFPCDFVKLRNDNAYRLKANSETLCGVEAGAFACAAMTGWQDGPLTMANYYTTAPCTWGLIDQATRRLTPSYYCFKAYGRLMRYPSRVKASTAAPLYALAGKNERGEIALLVTGFKNGAGPIRIDLDTVPASVAVEAVEEGLNLEAVPAKVDGKTIALEQKGNSAVFLITFTPAVMSPTGAFLDIAGATDSVAARCCGTKDGTCFSVANKIGTEVKWTAKIPEGLVVRDLSTGEKTVSQGSFPVALAPYRMRSFLILGRATPVAEGVEVPETYRRNMEERLSAARRINAMLAPVGADSPDAARQLESCEKALERGDFAQVEHSLSSEAVVSLFRTSWDDAASGALGESRGALERGNFTINCGCDRFLKKDGRTLLPDRSWSTDAPYGHLGGAASDADRKVDGMPASSPLRELCGTECYNITGYNFRLKPGNYTVKLHQRAGYEPSRKRGVFVMDVTVNGKMFRKDYDIFASEDPETGAATLVIRNVSPVEGVLSIGLTPSGGRAASVTLLNGIEIEKTSPPPTVDAASARPGLLPAPQELTWLEGASARTGITDIVTAGLPAEGYNLTVTMDGVRVEASDDAGFFYARQTLGQLARMDDAGNTVYPCVRIRDWPAYRWRGLMLDESRHFFGRATVERYLRLMASYKFNVFHWHLTDSDGWRLALDKYPELAGRGAVRPDSACHGRRRPGDKAPYGPFFYTEDDVRAILSLAKDLHIRMVPEIDMPGHAGAFLVAYPQFSCPWGGRQWDPQTAALWYGMQHEVCIGNDDAMTCLEGVLDEVCRLFDSPYIHLGGDECLTSRWEDCPRCQARMRANGLKDERGLQSWFTRRFSDYLGEKGRRFVGWDEVLEEGLPTNAVVMCYRKPSYGVDAAKVGYDVVMAPYQFCYLDYSQGLTNDSLKYFSGPLTLKKVYSFDPCAGVVDGARRHILGGEGENWSEFTWTPEELDWKVWPRACALAECLWTAPSNRDYAEFLRRLEPHRARLLAAGVNAAPCR